ncbi:MAG TPA: HEPN domain-containing protein [Nitrosopumilaceae archaeon]|nr:HEPN domain-containing protein [Nitrosopumilaceae archaeon]
MKQDRVEKFESDKDQIKNELENASAKLKSAKNVLGINEWGLAHTSAYEAMLHAGTALMFSKGYRTRGSEHHVTVVLFVQAVFSAKFSNKDVLDSFDRARKLRHGRTYDNANLISTTQAKNLVENAEAFVNITKEILKI